MNARALVFAVALVSACGGDGEVAPYTPPAPDCPEADDFLQPLYALIDEGALVNLSTAVSQRIPEDARRDLVDALLRLARSFEEGSFSALADLPPFDASRPGLQKTLGRVLRWLVAEGPGAPYPAVTTVLARAVATCEGGPVLSLLTDAVRDPTLLPALGEALGGEALGEALRGLSFEGASGREAMQYLVRNLLAAAASPAFEVDRVLDLLGLLVDLDAPPWDGLARSLESLLDADGLPRLQGLLVCLGDVDPGLELGGLAYDLVTSGLLVELLGVVPGGESGTELLPEPIRRLLAAALGFLAEDAEARRALVPTLLALLDPAVAPGVLSDVARMLEAEALGGLVDMIVELATGACRR
ncbi:MAG: hypothetical protein IT385_07900 [Deltaproteobacteria bacterium]|nr:hypothetical protein [Deltaproteobacteria bacterium]